jgi:hypothetical protein
MRDDSSDDDDDDDDPENPQPIGTKKFGRVLGIRDAVKSLRQSSIHELLVSKGFEPGDKAFLASYPAAVTELINAMSDHEKEEMQEVADKWNREGAPPEVQAK